MKGRYIDDRVAGVTEYYAEEPRDWNMRIPDLLLGSVVFLGRYTAPRSHKSVEYLGTGFFVTKESPEGYHFTYLVTAKHVAIALEDSQRPFMRLNDSKGAAMEISLGGATWTTHTDVSVDVAVWSLHGFFPAPLSLSTHNFALRKRFNQYGIGAGDEVFSVGLLSLALDEDTNVPVVRYGTIAMVPPKPLKKQGGGTMEVILVEARSLGGLSGSPVFVRETMTLTTPADILGKSPYAPSRLVRPLVVGSSLLLGVMRAHLDIDPTTLNQIYPTYTKRGGGGVNMGLAAVTPAEKILDILDDARLVRERDELVAKKKLEEEKREPAWIEDSATSAIEAEPPFNPAVAALFQVPKEAVDKAEKQRPKRPRKKH